MTEFENEVLDFKETRENELLRADEYVVSGLETKNPCVRKLFSKWAFGMMHGILTPQPKKVAQQLFGVISYVLSRNKKVLLIDALNVFNPELLLKSFKLYAVGQEKKEYSWFPDNLYYSRPFQYLQFYSLLTNYVPEFLSRHGRRTDLVIITDIFRMFLEPTEHYFDDEYPEKHVKMLISGLRVLKQTIYFHGVAGIVIMDEKFFSLPATDHFHNETKKIRKKLPVEAVFPVLLRWDYDNGVNRLKVIKHFDSLNGLECRESERALFQRKLDDFL